MKSVEHRRLPSGIELGVLPLPERHVVTFQIRLLTGTCDEPESKLGLAYLVEQTLDKGTQRRTGQQLSDAFDAIGAALRSGCGRETTTFTCAVLPEHIEQALALHAELLREPTFPQDAVGVAIDLAKQELISLDDDAQGLTDKMISRQAYGPILGRHTLGEKNTLDRIQRDDLVQHWRRVFHCGRMMVSAAGAIEPRRMEDLLEKYFSGFGPPNPIGRDAFSVQFQAKSTHYSKELEQQHIGICWPGVDATHDDFPVQQVILGVLSGGMSGRLFTEVREKLGLVYWVAAWQETPRGSGMIFLGASTTPERCDQTYATLLREVDRLAEDIEQEELERAVTGIVAQQETRGDSTRARCGELASDLFFYGRPIAFEEKIAKLQAVTVKDVQRYLAKYPRDRLCVVTLGPRALQNGKMPRST
ncbi:MAG: pitrilysin family protein [Planctomycetota bacterium]